MAPAPPVEDKLRDNALATFGKTFHLRIFRNFRWSLTSDKCFEPVAISF